MLSLFRSKPTAVPAQSGYGQPYRWPDGSLFYTQGDCVTCSRCRYVWRTGTGICPHCGAKL